MTSLPNFIVGKVIATDYLGRKADIAETSDAHFIRRVSDDPIDDLQTAGLTIEQLRQSAVDAHILPDPIAPTASQIRRLAIHSDYRGLIDVSAGGGFGVLFGPKPDARVFGREYRAFARSAPGEPLFILMAQIPENFDADHPMIMTAPSSGSRGIYGAISMAEWAFANRCAVAYTDKGTAQGFHVLDTDTVYDLDGLPFVTGSADRKEPAFKVENSADLDAYKSALPHRLALKHAHSEANVEAHWGEYVLLSIKFALFCLNDYLGAKGSFSRANTKVIAAGVSNAGGSALLAAEIDKDDLIDAVVVSEPQVQPVKADFSICFGDTVFTNHGRHFLDTITLLDVFAPCAAFVLDKTDAAAPLQQARAARCATLHAFGLLKREDTIGQAREALDVIHNHGLLREADCLLPIHEFFGFWRLLSAVFTNAYARASLTDHLCGVSIAPVAGGAPTKMPDDVQAQLCGWSNGLGYNLYPRLDLTDVVDDKTGTIAALGAALSFRSLVTGITYPQQNAVHAQWITSERVQNGIADVRACGNLRGKPATILHGRSDGLLPPNQTSRAYYGLNMVVEQNSSKLRYIEVINGNHFDSLIPTFAAAANVTTLVPMHYYLEKALTMMRDHLLDPGSNPLPASQVIPASADHKPWLEENAADLPPIKIAPAAFNTIAFADKTLTIPIGRREHADAQATMDGKLDAWMRLETALRDDVQGVLDLLDRFQDNQSLRRAFVRALWSFIEASVHGLGDFIRTAAMLSGSDDFLEEKRTIDRIKSTLRDGGRSLAGWEPNFGSTGWEAMRASLRIRDRLMHPKIPEQVEVSDEEVSTCKESAAWFLETIMEIQTRALNRTHSSEKGNGRS